MRCLFAAISTSGFLNPQLYIAKKWAAAGHEVAFATGQELEPVVAAAGFERLPRGEPDGPSFEVAGWPTPPAITRQVAHLEEAVRRFEPDVILASQLALGALIVGEVYRLPVAMLGMPFDLWPTEEKPSGGGWGTLKKYRAARKALGIANDERHESVACLKGDLLMLRTMEEWVPPEENRLAKKMVGIPPCLYHQQLFWEKNRPAFDNWLSAQNENIKHTVYVQPGRSFENKPWLPQFLRTIEKKPIKAAISTERYDGDTTELARLIKEVDGRHLALDFLPPLSIIKPDAVVMGGHATSVLAAIEAKTPLLCIAAGSRTEWMAEKITESRIGASLNALTVTEKQIAAQIESILSSDFGLAFDALHPGRADPVRELEKLMEEYRT